METSVIQSDMLLSEPNRLVRWRRKWIIRKRKTGKEQDGNEKKKRKPLLDAVDLKGKGAPIGEGPYGSSKILVAMTLQNTIT
jgi:hypothetical protein